MEVLKFGGTSVGSADRMQEVIDIIEKKENRQLIVLSAMSGTTNDLIAICDCLKNEDRKKVGELISEFETKYVRVLTDLFADKEIRDKGRALLRPSVQLLKVKSDHTRFSPGDEKEILAQGELMSTGLFSLLCELRGLPVALIPALAFMRTDAKGEPDIGRTSELLRPIIDVIDEEITIIVTQGYICKNNKGEVDNLRRGGSDYTATILGAALKADEIQIWTDIDGVHNNDPRIVDGTRPIRRLSYREAAELAYFGAKILHPTCVLPAEREKVPLRLKCVMTPQTPGTLISTQSSKRPITAIAAKDGITAIKICSHRMLQAYGFLTKVFQIFEKHQTSVDMIATSEVAVSLTIDDISRLDGIIGDLSDFAEVEFDKDYSIICIVGNALYDESEHVYRIFEYLRDIPIRMVSMGGSRNNVSLLVLSSRKIEALTALNKLFREEPVGIEEVTLS